MLDSKKTSEKDIYAEVSGHKESLKNLNELLYLLLI